MEGNLKKCFVAVLCIAAVVAKPSKLDRSEQTQLGFLDGDTGETDWFKTAQKEMMDSIDETLRITSRINQAKNIILFIGDGMGISTVTAARIYHAQSRQLVGDDVNLSFEKFPYVALSKTYNTDKQVGDSAATATAFTCGVKAKYGTLGVNQLVYRKNCTNTMENAVPSFIKYAMDDGKWTGVVSTTRVTHATPAATYAHSGERNWESDADVAREVEDPEDREQCKDIAYQLVHTEHNRDIRVILGGGRSKFMRSNQTDPEYPGQMGDRQDTEVSRRDLTDDPEIGQPNYEYDSAMYVSSETHAGEEVAIYARGPMSHLFHGTHEQNYIAHVLMYAACIGPNTDHCDKPRAFPFCADSGTTGHSLSYSLMLFAAFVAFIIKSFH